MRELREWYIHTYIILSIRLHMHSFRKKLTLFWKRIVCIMCIENMEKDIFYTHVLTGNMSHRMEMCVFQGREQEEMRKQHWKIVCSSAAIFNVSIRYYIWNNRECLNITCKLRTDFLLTFKLKDIRWNINLPWGEISGDRRRNIFVCSFPFSHVTKQTDVTFVPSWDSAKGKYPLGLILYFTNCVDIQDIIVTILIPVWQW